jgi:predicted  nucleic acid-binding Zn-ribbon protein
LRTLERIYSELAETNSELRSALADSERSYRELRMLYKQAEDRLTGLQTSLAGAEQSLQASVAHSDELLMLLRESRRSLASLERRFDDLERAWRRARLERWIWLVAGAAAGAAGGYFAAQ